VVNIGRWSTYEGGQHDRFYCRFNGKPNLKKLGLLIKNVHLLKFVCLMNKSWEMANKILSMKPRQRKWIKVNN
jgi:hypothetical protein